MTKIVEIIDNYNKSDKACFVSIIGTDSSIPVYQRLIKSCTKQLPASNLFASNFSQSITIDKITEFSTILKKYNLSEYKNFTAIDKIFKDCIPTCEKGEIIDEFKKSFSSYISIKISSTSNQESLQYNKIINFLVVQICLLDKYVVFDNQGEKRMIFAGKFNINETYFIELLYKIGYKILYLNGSEKLNCESETYEFTPAVIEPNQYFAPLSEEEKLDIISVKTINASGDLASCILLANNKNILMKKDEIIISRFYLRVVGCDGNSLDAIYKNVNSLFEICNNNEKNDNFKFININGFNANLSTLLESQKNAVSKFVSGMLDVDTCTDLIIDDGTIIGGFSIELKALIRKSVRNIVGIFDKITNANDKEEKQEIFSNLILLIKKSNKTINKVLEGNQIILLYGDGDICYSLYMQFMALVGINVFYVTLNKESAKCFVDIENIDRVSSTLELAQSVNNIDFPKERLINRDTTAYVASQEIDAILYNDNTGMFKPFQFDDKNIVNVNLKTTYEELEILLKAEARMRPSFDIDGENIYIPNIVAKVVGVTDKIKEYMTSVRNITNYEGSVVFDFDTKHNGLKKVGTLKEDTLAKYCRTTINGNVIIDVEKFTASNDFSYRHLKLSAQYAFVDKINTLINSDNIFSFSINADTKLSIAVFLLTLQFPNCCELLHNFNYYATIPKVYIFSTKVIEESLRLTYLVALMNLLAFDVVIFSPSAFSDIERYIESGIVTEHKLAKIEMDLKYKAIVKKRLFF